MFQNGTGVEKNMQRHGGGFRKQPIKEMNLPSAHSRQSEFNSLNAWQIGISKSLTVATDAAFPSLSGLVHE